MALVTMIRYLRGTVQFHTIGKYPEKLLNGAAARQLQLWKIERKGGTLFACTTPRDYRALRFAVRKTGIRLRIDARKGLPFLLRRFRFRLGAAFGLLLFFVLIQYLSMFVWNIEVTGGNEATREKVAAASQELGISSGVWKNSLSLKQAKEDLLRAMPELSWTSMNLTGCKLTIELRERNVAPEIIPTDVPCNLKARIGGVIVRVDAKAGFPSVKPGDTVAEGDLLVSGVRQDAFGATMLRHAQGSVIARTSHTVTCSIPLRQMTAVPTDEVIVRKRLAVFGVEVPLNLTSPPQEGSYTRTFEAQPVYLLGVQIPVERYTETWTKTEEREVVYTEQEAADQAEAELARLVQEQYPGATVVSSVKTKAVQNGVLTLTAVLQCEEDIAREEEILLGTEEVQK